MLVVPPRKSLWGRLVDVDIDDYRRCLSCGGCIVRLSNFEERRRHNGHHFRGISEITLWEWLMIKLKRY